MRCGNASENVLACKMIPVVVMLFEHAARSKASGALFCCQTQNTACASPGQGCRATKAVAPACPLNSRDERFSPRRHRRAVPCCRQETGAAHWRHPA